MGSTPYSALAPIRRYGEAEVHRQKVCHGLSKLCVEKTIEMTDTDIVRTPFFEHHIDEIIGDGVGMVVALVQLNFFLLSSDAQPHK